jgi:hypothetical protein
VRKSGASLAGTRRSRLGRSRPIRSLIASNHDTIRVVIAHAEPLFRDGIALLLDREGGFEVVGHLGKVLGAFWSAIPKKSNNQKRTTLDQARMQLLQQLVAAELNASAFGSVPTVGSFAAWETALCGTNTAAIQTAHQQASSFNSSGDSSTFTPGTSADSKTARALALPWIPFWDIIAP